MRLSARNISFKYKNGVKILEDVDLEVKSGEVVGLVAPSGFGKTTLAKILAGYEQPSRGRVDIEGVEKNSRYNPVQLIFQHPEKAINPKWKMGKVLSESRELSDDMIFKIGIKKEWLNRCSGELSGGELQRFCVARALNKNTKFLIADEMTTMLDAITSAQIWEVVLEYAKNNDMGILVISHEKHLIDRVCDRIVNLEKYKVKS